MSFDIPDTFESYFVNLLSRKLHYDLLSVSAFKVRNGMLKRKRI